MKPRTDKLAKLVQQADRGRHFADFAEDRFINEYFDGLEQRLVDDLAGGASSLPPETLRALAVSLKTVRDLRAFIKASAAEGQRAERAYSELAGMTNGK